METSSKIGWQDSFRIGSESVDAQHRSLFELAGQLVDLHESGGDPDLVDRVVQMLYGYVRIHFSDEEELMRNIGYVDIDDHRKLHDKFMLAFDDLVVAKRGTDTFVPSLVELVNTWLRDHIIHQDTKIRAG